jgi:ribosomal protein S27AE
MVSRAELNKKPQADNLEPVIRKCLMCFIEFMSQHKGERVCGTCKSTLAWRQG